MWMVVYETWKAEGDFEAARILQWIITVRMEAFSILLLSEEMKSMKITPAVARAASYLKNDLSYLDS